MAHMGQAIQAVRGLIVQPSSWKIRRRIIVITLFWCGVMVTYLSVWGRDIQLSETSVNGLLLLMASVIGSYVFGATWDSSIQRKAEVDTLAVGAGIPPNSTGGAGGAATVVVQPSQPASSAPAAQEGP